MIKKKGIYNNLKDNKRRILLKNNECILKLVLKNDTSDYL